jgi:hypothetical protein
MATTRYIDAVPTQAPFDPGALDASSRALRQFNVLLTKVPSAGVAGEILQLLADESVGTVGTDMFDGSKAPVPTGAGPYLTVTETSGVAGIRTHNVATGPAYERPGILVTVRPRTRPSPSPWPGPRIMRSPQSGTRTSPSRPERARQ